MGRVTSVRLVHSAKAYLPILVRESERVKLVRPDAWKALSPMEVTAEGRVKVFSAAQPLKASYPIVVRPEPKDTVSMDGQLWKAPDPIEVTLSAKMTLFKLAAVLDPLYAKKRLLGTLVQPEAKVTVTPLVALPTL